MEDWKSGRNSCYTYFKITGYFNPDAISAFLGLFPTKHWHIGDLRNNGTPYDFALWEYGRCDEYDVLVGNQMMKTIENLIPKTDALCQIKKQYNVDFTLEIVPSIYANDVDPSLSPNREVIEFCYKTNTNIDIDLYVFDSSEQ